MVRVFHRFIFRLEKKIDPLKNAYVRNYWLVLLWWKEAQKKPGRNSFRARQEVCRGSSLQEIQDGILQERKHHQSSSSTYAK